MSVKKTLKFRVTGTVFFLLCSLLAAETYGEEMTPEEKHEIGLELTKLFRAARSVIAQNQGMINDPNKGDKGLNGETVIALALESYKASSGEDFNMADRESLKGQVQHAILTAAREVMDNAQPLINQRGLGFKRFLPAIFGRQVAESFNRIIKGKTHLKLTAPQNYIRNRTNRPDNWENNVIEKIFKAPNYPKDKPYTEVATLNGRNAYRFMIPEYYTEVCLNCHGEPKGEKDISGGRKEGGKLGDIGGAVSFAIFN